MAKQMGIWIDKRQAKVVHLDVQDNALTTIESEVDEFNPIGGSRTARSDGPQDVVQDSRYLEREKHQLKDFFDRLADQLAADDSVVVFGPAQTGHKLADHIRQTYPHLSDTIVGVEKADSMTDNQVKAWVREYFGH